MQVAVELTDELTLNFFKNSKRDDDKYSFTVNGKNLYDLKRKAIKRICEFNDATIVDNPSSFCVNIKETKFINYANKKFIVENKIVHDVNTKELISEIFDSIKQYYQNY